MSDQSKLRIRKSIGINQGIRSVSISVFRWQGEEMIGHHVYVATPYLDNPVHSDPGFVARRIRRGIRMLDASLRREWGQS